MTLSDLFLYILIYILGACITAWICKKFHVDEIMSFLNTILWPIILIGLPFLVIIIPFLFLISWIGNWQERK